LVLPPALVAAIDQLAELADRSRNKIIETILTSAMQDAHMLPMGGRHAD
jgi:hypothetical protein